MSEVNNYQLTKRGSYNQLAVGPVHLGAAAFAALTLDLVAVYLKWLAGVEIPAEVLLPTNAWVGGVVGYFYPNDPAA